MKSKKILSLFLAVLMLAALMASCASPSPSTPATTSSSPSPSQAASESSSPSPSEAVTAEDVALKVWAPIRQIEKGIISQMCDEFKVAHPEWNITFTVEAQEEDTLKDSLLKDVAAAGDIFFFSADQTAELVNAGAIAKLGGAAADLVKNEMAETVANTVTVDGSIYAVPFTHNTFFMFYDKTLMTEEDVKTVEGIMSKKTADDVYNFCFDDAGGWKLGAWYYGAGNTVYGADGNDFAAGCDWNNATGVAVTKYIMDLLANKKCAYNADVTVSELIATHRLGAWFDGAWNYQSYKDVLGDNLGLAVLPTFSPNGTAAQLKGFYGSKAVGVNPQAKNMPAAVAFASFINNAEMQILRFTLGNEIPTNKNASTDPAVVADELASVIMAEADMASVIQPANALFGSHYWTNTTALMADIKGGVVTAANVQEKLDAFVAKMNAE